MRGDRPTAPNVPPGNARRLRSGCPPAHRPRSAQPGWSARCHSPRLARRDRAPVRVCRGRHSPSRRRPTRGRGIAQATRPCRRSPSDRARGRRHRPYRRCHVPRPAPVGPAPEPGCPAGKPWRRTPPMIHRVAPIRRACDRPCHRRRPWTGVDRRRSGAQPEAASPGLRPVDQGGCRTARVGPGFRRTGPVHPPSSPRRRRRPSGSVPASRGGGCDRASPATG